MVLLRRSRSACRTTRCSTRFLDEDCLTLPLWSPGTDDARSPVLVWIHGGGMTTGAGSWDVYSCEEFVRNGDLVAVSINYRLGPLGSLYAEEDGGGAATSGLTTCWPRYAGSRTTLQPLVETPPMLPSRASRGARFRSRI